MRTVKPWQQRDRVVRDLAYSMYFSKAEENAQNMIDKILTSDRQNKLKFFSSNIEKLKEILEEDYQYFNFQEKSVLDDLINEITKKELLENKDLGSKYLTKTDLGTTKNLAKQILNDDDLRKQRFINNYNRMNDIMLQSADEITAIMEGFRGDKLLYGIGTTSSLTIMTATEYSKFERNNRDLFRLQFSEHGTLQNLSLDMNAVIDTAKLQKESRSDLIRNRLKNNNIVNNLFENSELRQTWNQLKSAKLYNKNMYGKSDQEAMENYSARQRSLWRARRLEHLFEDDVLEGNIQKIDRRFSNQENITGFATGDFNFQIDDSKFALQFKYFNGKDSWNGVSINSIKQSLNFFTDKDKILSKFQKQIYNNQSAVDKNFKALFGMTLEDYKKEIDDNFKYKASNTLENIFKNQLPPELYDILWSQFEESDSIDTITQGMEEQVLEDNSDNNDPIVGNYE